MSVEYITTKDWDESAAAYHLTPVVRADGFVFTSGETGADASSEPLPQFEAVFAGVAETLAAAGGSWDDVIKMTTYHVGGVRTHLDAFLAVKDRFVKAPFPAWTAVGVTDLASPDALVEIEVVAHLSA